MSDAEEVAEEKLFIVEKAKNNRAGCKHCKQKCTSGEVRFVKLTHNPFAPGKMRNCYHINCMLEVFLKQRPTTKRIQSLDDLDGVDDLTDEDRKMIEEKISESEKDIMKKYNLTATPKKPAAQKRKEIKAAIETPAEEQAVKEDEGKDGTFREFRRLVADITNVSSYKEKTALVTKLFAHGSDGVRFRSDVKLWCRLLLPGVVKRIYNLKSKQLVKLFSRMFNTDHDDMLTHLEEGDVSETIQHFFTLSKTCKPANKSVLTMRDVDEFLEVLSTLTKEDEQIHHFKKILPKCTANELKVIIRLIKGDLKMNAGAKHILEGVHPDAYEAFQSSRDLNAVIDKCITKSNKKTSVEANVKLMTPVLPMLAQACRSVEQAMKKCPNGMFSEIKYDGERVQVHKHGSDFQYYSRSLKPVMTHKISHFKDFIPQAFPHGKDLILDSEILLVDVATGKPLPFGSLGVHKQNQFQDANVCLFVFDCIYYNGEDLTSKPLKRRKEILKTIMNEIPNRIVFSEMEEIHAAVDLKAMIAKVLKLGLEGLVLKDLKSVYEPGKRHWLKVKKDYLFGGAIADTADLIVLGAWYGTGKKGGMMSIYLMGCYDEKKKRFCTVTKVHNGLDDETLERLQGEMDMVKISREPSKVPDWLNCSKIMIPDFVARDPKTQPIWEITGAEFTKQYDVHTADGISIRFPRLTKIRTDKDWKSATSLEELKKIFAESKVNTDVSLLMKNDDTGESASTTDTNDSPRQKRKHVADDKSPKNHKRNGNILDYLPSTSKASPPKKTESKRKRKNGASLQLSEDRVKIDSPLPDYFDKINLLVENSEDDDIKKSVRYFIAYGGNVVTKNNQQMATHVLHASRKVQINNMGNLKNAVHITADWIKVTVCKGILQDDKKYRVCLLPD